MKRMATTPAITYEDLLQQTHDQYMIFDTRSPKEFEESHIPGSINLPLLSNEERVIIGILYKQQGREPALKRGFEMIFHKFDTFFSAIQGHTQKQLIIQCWRGGLRSQLVVDMFLNKDNIIQMIKDVGADVPIDAFAKKLDALPPLQPKQLVGGYKKYREYVRTKLEQFDYSFQFVVLHGLSCTYKTHLLDQLAKKGYPVLDLEKMVQHRGSVLGGIGLSPRSQKMVENEMVELLESWKHAGVPFVFIEGESRKVGQFIIPEKLFQRLLSGIPVLVTATDEERIHLAMNEYFETPEKREGLKKELPRLTKFLGKQKIDELIQHTDDKHYDELFRLLFKQYYDVLYNKTLKALDFKLTVHWKEIEKLEHFFDRLHKQ